MAQKIVIIGAGPGGYVAAVRAAQLGAEVTVVERDNVGGTCLNWGCIPSKVMKTTADMLDNFRKASAFGIQVTGSVDIDMEKLTLRKQQIIQNQSQGILNLFNDHNIRYLRGEANITGPTACSVTLGDGETHTVQWDKLILATGSAPLNGPAFSFDGDRIISSNDALYLKDVPGSILVLGGGVIGCEFASIFAALGSRVVLVEAFPRLLPLPSVDEACSKILQREMKKRKIQVLLNRTAIAVDKDSEKFRITLGPSPFAKETKPLKTEPETVDVEKMLVCIGRQPNTTGIGLENIGIATDSRGWIVADDRMQTNIAGVYAVGDVLGPSRIMLAHVASAEGIIAVDNALGNPRKMDYRVVPGVIFSQPETANVGLTEAQAKEQGYSVRSDSVLFRTLGKAHVIGEIAGEVKMVSSIDDGEILGVHIIGPHAGDLIAEGALAMQLGATVADLAETIHAHPTLSEAMLEVSLKALGRPLHG